MGRPHENDDLWYALHSNPPKKFRIDDVMGILAEVPGENDELSWWWVLELGGGRFVLLSAWCDYTGWDCQSGINTEDIYSTAMQAASAAPEYEHYYGRGRAIRENLVGQLEGRYPLYTYVEPERGAVRDG